MNAIATSPLNKLMSSTNAPSLSPSNLFDRFNYSVVAILFYNYVYTILASAGHTLEITVILLEMFIAWIILDYAFRKLFPHLWTVTENALWYTILIGMLDFVSWILALVLIQSVLSNAMNAWSEGNLNYAESATAGYAILFISIPLYYNLKSVMEN